MAKKLSREEQKKKDNAAGLFIPAGFFLGFGVGFAVDNIPAGMFVGLGAGFFMYAIANYMSRKQ
ncbi:MAG: hypothetical protein PHO02_07010 [Candidatus Nanoarchaeia archaeon]|nr:hypothetical protein [Candidatus Nanoarchaeia archaeon]